MHYACCLCLPQVQQGMTEHKRDQQMLVRLCELMVYFAQEGLTEPGSRQDLVQGSRWELAARDVDATTVFPEHAEIQLAGIRLAMRV